MAIFKKDHKDAPVDHAVDADQGDGVAQGRQAQRAENKPDPDQPARDALRGAAPLREGATTTTTTDSLQNQGSLETQNPGELDKRTPEERLEQVRGWKKKIGPRQPQSADWEELDEIVGTGSIADARRAT